MNIHKVLFLDKLVMESGPGGTMRLHAPMLCAIYTPVRRLLVEVHAGFETDGASIPRALWSIVGSPWSGDWDKAAVLHDFLYRHPLPGMTRSDADSAFLAGLIELGIPSSTRWAMHKGVRLGGWSMWNKYRAEEAKEK